MGTNLGPVNSSSVSENDDVENYDSSGDGEKGDNSGGKDCN